MKANNCFMEIYMADANMPFHLKVYLSYNYIKILQGKSEGES